MLLQAEQLHRHYGEQDVLTGVDLRVDRGEMVAVLGASGTGKSTLLNILGLLDVADGGTYSLVGVDITTASENKRTRLRARHIGFVFQGFHLLPEFTVLENVLMPARCLGTDIGACRERARALLERVELAATFDKDVTTLSGGERQRVALCRALVLEPDLVLADEPTGNLDPQTATTVFDLLRELTAESSAVVVVTHDPQIAARTDRQYVLANGVLTPTE